MTHFRSTILILPGLGNSGDGHWQTIWENQFGFTRIIQDAWETPDCANWVETIEKALSGLDVSNVILVGHSLACCAIGYWSRTTKRQIRGALLVAPNDTEASSYPPGTTGFAPMPLTKLPFPSLTIASMNDFYVTPDRARTFASAWNSELVFIGEAGHINVASGFGAWPEGIDFLGQLDRTN
jgi:uncharacterized protein